MNSCKKPTGHSLLNELTEIVLEHYSGAITLGPRIHRFFEAWELRKTDMTDGRALRRGIKTSVN